MNEEREQFMCKRLEEISKSVGVITFWVRAIALLMAAVGWGYVLRLWLN